MCREKFCTLLGQEVFHIILHKRTRRRHFCEKDFSSTYCVLYKILDRTVTWLFRYKETAVFIHDARVKGSRKCIRHTDDDTRRDASVVETLNTYTSNKSRYTVWIFQHVVCFTTWELERTVFQLSVMEWRHYVRLYVFIKVNKPYKCYNLIEQQTLESVGMRWTETRFYCYG